MIRLFRVSIPTSVLALLFSDIVLVFACFVAAVYLLPYPSFDPQTYLLYDGGLERISITAGMMILCLYFQDLYSNFRSRFRTELVQQLCLTIGMVFLAQAFLSYVYRDLVMPKWLMIIGGAMTLVVLSGWRILYGSAVWKALGRQNLLFLGNSPVALEIAEHLKKRPEFGLRVMGYLGEGLDDQSSPEESIPRLGHLRDMKALVNELKPDQIVIGMQERRNRLPVMELLDLRFTGIRIEEISILYETTFGRVCSREIRPSNLIFSRELGPGQRQVRLQGLYSFALALGGVLIAFPVMVLIAILIKLTSRGPILHRQERVGLHDRPFTILKFRSMRVGAEASTGPVRAIKNDPRVTGLGRLLRQLRLDELPQLINVLRGQMSIVGPRPERTEFVRELNEQIPYYRQRHSVKPGITGWAQINYKYGDTVEDTIIKLEYDLYYIKNLSMSLDIYIIFHTLKTMLLSRGAQ